MLIPIRTTEGNTELVNPVNICKIYCLKSGNPRINMIDGSYTVTTTDLNYLLDMINEGL